HHHRSRAQIAGRERHSGEQRQKNHQRQPCRLSCATSFGPNTSSRSAASSSAKPAGVVLSRRRMSAKSLVAASRTSSAKRSPLGSLTTAIKSGGVSLQDFEQGANFAAAFRLRRGSLDALVHVGLDHFLAERL